MANDISRRGLVTAIPPVIAASYTPALPESTVQDLELLALRAPWKAACAAFEAALDRKSEIEEKIYASAEPYPDFKAFGGSWEEYQATVLRISADRAEASEALGGPEIDRLEDQTSEAVTRVLERIEAVPARTLSGLCFKAEVSKSEDHRRPEIIESIMEDIEAMAKARFA